MALPGIRGDSAVLFGLQDRFLDAIFAYDRPRKPILGANFPCRRLIEVAVPAIGQGTTDIRGMSIC
jgi:hypothetical protein